VRAVKLAVGPVASASVVAFADHAEAVLDGKVRGIEAGAGLPPDVLADFRRRLREWRRLAADGTAFRWEAEVAGDQAEYLIHAFYRLARRLDAAAVERGLAGPDEAQPFYRLLVGALLDGLADEGTGAAEFADHLRSFWPGGAES
jgi:hypothetical protein